MTPDRRPPASARSLLCSAPCPDSAETGYPYAFQVYDRTRRAWRWLILGCGYGPRKTTQTGAKGQAECHIFWGQIKHGWFRWAWITRWIRRPRGWAAVIDRKRCSIPVWVDKGRDPNKGGRRR